MENQFGNVTALAGTEFEISNPSRAERRDRQTQRILDAAKLCFVRSGFQGASMHHICAEAGMSPGALYRYFSSKEAIIAALCESDRREDARIFEAVLGKPDAVEGMVLAAMTHIRFVHETKAAPLFAQICAEAVRNEAVEAACRKNVEQVQALFRAYLSAAKERGDIDPPVDIDILVQALMAIIHGMALNDLPSLGVPREELEILVRSSLEGMLRPVTAARRTDAGR